MYVFSDLFHFKICAKSLTATSPITVCAGIDVDSLETKYMRPKDELWINMRSKSTSMLFEGVTLRLRSSAHGCPVLVLECSSEKYYFVKKQTFSSIKVRSMWRLSWCENWGSRRSRGPKICRIWCKLLRIRLLDDWKMKIGQDLHSEWRSGVSSHRPLRGNRRRKRNRIRRETSYLHITVHFSPGFITLFQRLEFFFQVRQEPTPNRTIGFWCVAS